MILKRDKEFYEKHGAILIPGTPTNNDNILKHILNHNTPSYRKDIPM